ncbi:ammonium transporter [Scytonema sp. PCC 10023]|uniref:ammonium transporter n=1 Tax=Scytonema sp. PCC 10023 TaxID=1680591 RepID=UPI0039C68A61
MEKNKRVATLLNPPNSFVGTPSAFCLRTSAFLSGKPTAVGAATGAVAGLVGITPAAGFVTPVAAILIGSITAFVCFYAITFKHKLQIDDALDTYPVHGVGGTVGAILTGIFATTTVNSAGKNGLLYGNPGQLIPQILATVVAYIIGGVGTFIILKIVDATVGLRVKEEAELQGLDINEHGEEGYNEEFTDRINFSSKQ